jgi:hypothetical protein
VSFNRSITERKIINADSGQIISIDDKKMILQLDTGKKITLKRERGVVCAGGKFQKPLLLPV